MTSSATLLTRDELKLAGLVEHQLLRPLEPREQKRWLYVTKDIDALLSGKSNSAFPSHEADVLIGRFCKGLIVSITRKTEGKADFKKLKDHDEAWVGILNGPGEGWRLFGRFARRNVFVGLTCWPRGQCVPWQAYQDRATDMIATWQSTFATDPLRSNNYSDFLSDPFYDKDAT